MRDEKEPRWVIESGSGSVPISAVAIQPHSSNCSSFIAMTLFESSFQRVDGDSICTVWGSSRDTMGRMSWTVLLKRGPHAEGSSETRLWWYSARKPQRKHSIISLLKFQHFHASGVAWMWFQRWRWPVPLTYVFFVSLEPRTTMYRQRRFSLCGMLRIGCRINFYRRNQLTHCVARQQRSW